MSGRPDGWGRYMVAATAATVVVWFAFVAHSPVPVLDWFDLGMHETGHLITAFMAPMVMFIAGSVAQVAVPLFLAWYFGYWRRDAAGGGFCLAWAGASMWDVSVYIADAPIQALPLIGGGQHDWAYLLGPAGWDVMHLADEIAGYVEATGGVIAVAGASIAIWGVAVRILPAADSAPLAARPHGSVEAGVDPWKKASDLPFYHHRDD